MFTALQFSHTYLIFPQLHHSEQANGTECHVYIPWWPVPTWSTAVRLLYKGRSANQLFSGLEENFIFRFCSLRHIVRRSCSRSAQFRLWMHNPGVVTLYSSTDIILLNLSLWLYTPKCDCASLLSALRQGSELGVYVQYMVDECPKFPTGHLDSICHKDGTRFSILKIDWGVYNAFRAC